MISVHGGNDTVTITIQHENSGLGKTEQMTVDEARRFAQDVAQACAYAENYGSEEHG